MKALSLKPATVCTEVPKPSLRRRPKQRPTRMVTPLSGRSVMPAWWTTEPSSSDRMIPTSARERAMDAA